MSVFYRTRKKATNGFLQHTTCVFHFILLLPELIYSELSLMKSL